MGATDPKKAAKGTIRADFAQSIDANAVHGSDSPETAAVEIAFFFPQMDIYAGRLIDRACSLVSDVKNIPAQAGITPDHDRRKVASESEPPWI
mgnify:FL=1